MSSDYAAIRRDNEKRYGTDIGRIGPMLLADRYDDRTHFIFELLQNAEDSMKKRAEWSGPREIAFALDGESLTVSHYGRPFDEADVRGVCGIAESTKDANSIGRFGIGFKSVYTFTDRPEIHSGAEAFAIEKYVWPTVAAPRERQADETRIWLPLKSDDLTAHADLEKGFRSLGASSLLFLKHIEQIGWSVKGAASGVYMRSAPETLGPNVRRITVIGQETGRPDVDQTWLVFDREVFSADGKSVGSVELAFSTEKGDDAEWVVQPIATSPLVVFFPTVVSTHLGFLVQGPYRTTPSRDNVPKGDPWNQHLVDETAMLLIDAVRWLRDQDLWDVSGLRCLPLNEELFPEGSMFAPLFEAVREALTTEPLLPRYGGGYVEATRAKLARTQEIRDLLDPGQITAIFGGDASAWLSGDITQDRAPDVREYVINELDVSEITPVSLVPKLSKGFLEAQTDDWVVRLYEFLAGQGAALARRADPPPLVRLTDGTHVTPLADGKPNAFLPAPFASDFPTVRAAVCASPEAIAFLRSLGLTEPDPVDDVIWNLLPKYRKPEVDVSDDDYAADIARILKAFATDSAVQKEKLLLQLRETSFVMAVDAGDGAGYVSRPGDVYIATERLKTLFAQVPGVFIVDDSYPCLRGEPVRDLLEACGALRYLRPEDAPKALTWDERRKLRVEAGHEQTSGSNDSVTDWDLEGLNALIATLPSLPPDQRLQRAQTLWDSLSDLEDRRGHGVFTGSYSWTHYGSYRKEFPSAFIRTLNSAAWIPDEDGSLHPPSDIVFETLGWKENAFLASKIAFKPALLDELAREAGIDPAALDFLRRHGLTNLEELKARLGIEESSEPQGDEQPGDEQAGSEPADEEADQESSNPYDDASDLYGDEMPDIAPGTPDPDGGDSLPSGSGGSGSRSGGDRSGRDRSGTGSTGGSNRGNETSGRGKTESGSGAGPRMPGKAGGRPFVSYVAAEHDDDGSDPDGLDQAARMKIEEVAIDRIIAREPQLARTAAGNAGFDLFEPGPDRAPNRWVEVKAMTGSLKDRPVGLSKPQFDLAAQKGDAFWLYVVERASDDDQFRILRIQDPARKAKTFTFDHGWAEIAHLDPPHVADAADERIGEDANAK